MENWATEAPACWIGANRHYFLLAYKMIETIFRLAWSEASEESGGLDGARFSRRPKPTFGLYKIGISWYEDMNLQEKTLFALRRCTNSHSVAERQAAQIFRCVSLQNVCNFA